MSDHSFQPQVPTDNPEFFSRSSQLSSPLPSESLHLTRPPTSSLPPPPAPPTAPPLDVDSAAGVGIRCAHVSILLPAKVDALNASPQADDAGAGLCNADTIELQHIGGTGVPIDDHA